MEAANARFLALRYSPAALATASPGQHSGTEQDATGALPGYMAIRLRLFEDDLLVDE